MAVSASRLRLAGLLLLAAVAFTGCNPLLLPYLFHGDPKQPPTLRKLTNKDKAVRIVFISFAPGADSTPEGVGADRELCRKLVANVLAATKSGDEKVDLVAPKSVEKFKNEHPDWYKMELKTVGEYFKADYVVYLEMEQFDLLESGGLMYRGRTQINVQLQDMHDAVGEPELPKVCKIEYPKRGPVPVDDTNVSEFRSKFIEVVARELSWLFIEHGTGMGIADEN
jgi:hypothetical protein